MGDFTFAFIGLGLIGGSVARGLKRYNPSFCTMAYMRTRSKLEQAKKDGVIDVILDGIGPELSECDVIFLCAPVEHNVSYLSMLRPYLKPRAIITDVGSTKTDIHQAASRLDMGCCFIGGHPMAGSEKTGYENSTDHLLENAYYVVTPSEESSEESVGRMVRIAEMTGSIPVVLDYRKHDFVAAAISHLPHIVASSLVGLVRDSDDENEMMKRLAAGGFKDITRIASSSPDVWEQICMANRQNIAVILERYINSLQNVLEELMGGDEAALHRLFDSSRTYRDSISDRVKGSLTPDYSFAVDIVDEAGSISTLSVILAAKGISIRNIGINHNREHGGGALRVSFYDRESMERAWAQLKKYHYELFR